MATSAYRNKNQRRPRKTAGERRQRMKTQRRRLEALGVISPEEIAKLGSKHLRQAVVKAEQQAARAKGQ